MTTTTGISALTEIEYRAWWLEQEIRDGRRTPKAVLLEELAGIRASVERERTAQESVAERLDAQSDRLDEAIARMREWLGPAEAPASRHLRVVPTPSEGGRDDAETS